MFKMWVAGLFSYSEDLHGGRRPEAWVWFLRMGSIQFAVQTKNDGKQK